MRQIKDEVLHLQWMLKIVWAYDILNFVFDIVLNGMDKSNTPNSHN